MIGLSACMINRFREGKCFKLYLKRIKQKLPRIRDRTMIVPSMSYQEPEKCILEVTQMKAFFDYAMISGSCKVTVEWKPKINIVGFKYNGN